MRLVVDSNVIISALIKRSKTLELIFDGELELFVPEFAFEEIENHIEYISRRSNLSKEELALFLESIKQRITIVPAEEFKQHLKEAAETSPDSGDIPYFALCKRLDVALWSNDKWLKRQTKMTVLSTKEVVNHLLKTKR